MARLTQFLAFTWFLFLTAGVGWAQSPGMGQVAGILQDSITALPVPFATVAVFNQSANVLTTSGTGDEQGHFVLTGLAPGAYRLLVSSLNYVPRNLLFLMKASGVNLGTVRLHPTAQQLQDVEVIGQQALIEDRADRLVYNADKDITVRGGTATDIMRKVPMVAVDLDGNVTLRGSPSVKVLLNGKPSAITAGSVADALKQLPADVIQSVEVITSPSAKYDAEGSAGIINIVTKPNTLQGFSLGVESGLGNRGGSLSVNGSYRTGKMGFSLNGSGWVNYGIHGDYHNTQTIGATATDQTAITSSHAQFGQYTLGWDYDLNPHNSLTTSVRVGARNSYAQQDNLATRSFGRSQAWSLQDMRSVLTTDLSNSLDVTTVYTHLFKPNQEFSLLALYSQNNRHNDFTADILSLPDATPLLSRDRNENPSQNRETTLQADYQMPLGKKQVLEVGSKAIFRQAVSDYDYLRDSTGQGSFDRNLRNLGGGLHYQQAVLASYTTYTVTLPQQLTIKAGLRYEYTTIDAQFLQQLANDRVLTVPLGVPNYGVWNPSLALSKVLKGDKTIKLAYNRRLQRPGIQYLNPNVNLANPLSIMQGNPQLAPELTHNLELSTGASIKDVYVNAALFARFTKQAIQPVRDTVSITAAVGNPAGLPSIRTSYQNIGQEQTYGLNLTGNGTLFKKWQLGGGIDIYHASLTNDSPNPLYRSTNTGWVLAGRLSSGLALPKGWSVQGFGLLLARQIQVQGYQGGFTFYMLGLKKEFNDRKGSVGLAAENFFNHPFTVRSELASPVLTQRNETSYYNAGVRVNFSYRFGKLRESTRTRKAITNDDVKGGVEKSDKQ